MLPCLFFSEKYVSMQVYNEPWSLPNIFQNSVLDLPLNVAYYITPILGRPVISVI